MLLDPELAELAHRCAEAADIDLRHLLCEAPDAELRLTQNAQPALLFTGIALARLMARRGIRPRALAGHSVGEYAALVVGGALSPEEGMRAVAERGRAMSMIPGSSGMAAVLGLGVAAVASVLEPLPAVWPANYNTPTQTVVGGENHALEAALPLLTDAGARRVLMLNVAAAFHTPLMRPAGVSLRRALDMIEWRAPQIPVVANVTAAPHRDGAVLAELLEQQLSAPVRWSQSVQTLLEMGCDTFFELGPRRALSGMMRELAPTAEARPLSTPAAIAELEWPL